MQLYTLQNFIAEASNEIPALRRGILSLGQPGADAASAAQLIGMARTIRNGAAACAAADTESRAAELESALAEIAVQRHVVTQPEIARLLDRLADLEESLLQNYFGDSSESIDVSAFVDESFDSLQCSVEASGESSDGLSGFEIDDELLEVFAIEAEELLRNIETSLETMSRDPRDRDALWTIRRNAHTFKGSAAIVGFQKPSELAHRIEDLLDRMAERDFESPVPLFDVLRHSTDCLRAMTAGDSSHELAERVSDVYREFDRVLEALSEPATVDAVVDTAAEPIQILSDAPVTSLEIPPLPGTEPRQHFYRKRSIVRVPLERLDDLVRITRDLLIDRSVFEQRLRDLENQISELQSATRRLQTTSVRLEIDYEATMLSPSSNVPRTAAIMPATDASADAAAFDELEFDRYTDFHQSARQLSEAASDTVAIGNALESVHGSFETLFDHHRKLVEEMQDHLLGIRMVEFGALATRLQRAVTVTCEETGKKVRLTIENQNQLLDTQILDALGEPLMHLLKNAVVHGIEPAETRRLLGKPETGEILLNIVNEETHVLLTVSDDGRGVAAAALKEKAVAAGSINRERADEMSEAELCELMFIPGLTTAEKLNFSAGRGVGMSIVKESLAAQRGSISVKSQPQKGTCFTVRVPLTLAVTNVLLVKAGRQTYAVPLKLIKRISELSATDAERCTDAAASGAAGDSAALSPLCKLIGSPAPAENAKPPLNVLQIEFAATTHLVPVDEIVRTEEIVIKPLGQPLEQIKGLLGAAILGNGELVPVLDMPHLLNNMAVTAKPALTAVPVSGEIIVMVVDDSPSVRHMTSKIVTNAGWTVVTARDGIDALEQLKSAVRLPDIILSDIEMPRMDGYELVATLRRIDQLRHIPVVMITSRAGAKHRDKAFENGVSAFLTKPYEEKELIAAVENLAKSEGRK